MSGGTKLVIKCVNPAHATAHRIQAIKALRMITFFGLKESKDAIESCIDGETITVTEASSHARAEAAASGSGYGVYDFNSERNMLCLSGFAVEADTFRSRIEVLAKQAVDSGEYQIAIDLLGVLQARHS